MGIREINLQEEIPHYTKEQVYGILIPTIGKTLEELDINRVFDKTVMNPKVTGIAGDVIEQSVFGYKANNKQIPDLNVDNEDVELKIHSKLGSGLSEIRQGQGQNQNEN